MRGYWRLEEGTYDGGGPGVNETYSGDIEWSDPERPQLRGQIGLSNFARCHTQYEYVKINQSSGIVGAIGILTGILGLLGLVLWAATSQRWFIAILLVVPTGQVLAVAAVAFLEPPVDEIVMVIGSLLANPST